MQGMQSWQEAAEAFFQRLDVSTNSVRTYREALKTFYRWWDGKNRPPFTKDTMREFRDWLKGCRAINTVMTYSVALKRFFKDAQSHGFVDHNPMDDLKQLRRPQGHLRRDLTRTELRAVFDQIDRSTLLGKRDYAMVNLMARNGLRIIEVHRSNYGDLEQRLGRTILRVMGKGRDERDEFVVLSEATVEALMEYLNVRGDLQSKSPLFSQSSALEQPAKASKNKKGELRISVRHIRRRVTDYFKRAGVKTPKTTVHSLRHSFVTLAIQGGASIMEAQAAARHRSIQTTMIYFHEHGRLDNPIEDRIKI
jgi:integrase/recombinase XerC/integrase/recombinase XerD